MLSASVSDTDQEICFFKCVKSALLQEVFRYKNGLSNFIEFTKMSEHEHFGGFVLSDIEVTFLKWQWHLKAQ